LKWYVIIFFIAVSTLFPQKHFNKYDDTFRKYSKRFFGPGYDWKVFKAQSIAESGLSPDAVSYVGARGLMQLMPSTFEEVKSYNPEFKAVDDPEWNIAAGIFYDRTLFRAWKDIVDNDKLDFTFGSYNAGRGTIMKAQLKAKDKQLDHTAWQNITIVAPEVRYWRYEETIGYVEKIKKFREQLLNK
jgi:soluble lytic murein transglycosylase-like protein